MGHFRVSFCLCKSESSCETICMKNVFRQNVLFYANQSHLHMKCFARRLVLKQRYEVTRNWPQISLRVADPTSREKKREEGNPPGRLKCRFSVHIMLKKFWKRNNHGSICFRKTLAEKSCDFCDAIVFKMSFVHTKTQNRRLQRPPVEVEKLRFRDGLARALGLTIEIKLRFHISSAWRGRGQLMLRRNSKGKCSQISMTQVSGRRNFYMFKNC